jgi:hypothetical protein
MSVLAAWASCLGPARPFESRDPSCDMFSTDPRTQGWSVTLERSAWYEHVSATEYPVPGNGWSPKELDDAQFEAHVPRWAYVARRRPSSENPFDLRGCQRWYAEDFAVGWPAYGMHARRFIMGDNSRMKATGIPLPSGRWWVWPYTIGPCAPSLPLAPLWPGFALDTVFYAAIAWGLYQLPLAIRRRRRRHSDSCVKCGYDRRGLAVGAACPECGRPPA